MSQLSTSRTTFDWAMCFTVGVEGAHRAGVVITLVLLVLWTIISMTASVAAMPAFARKYRTACTTCHTAIPLRNAFGEAFRRNGYIMPKQDRNQIKQQPVELGAEAWKEVFPKTIWPSVLPAEFPLAAYLHQRITADMSQSAPKKGIRFDLPHELELILGGTFDQTFSFFGEYLLFEDGKSEPELERLFIQMNDLLGPDNLFNLRFGLLEPGITDGMTGNQGIMLEKPATLTYRATGMWRPKDPQSGLEINGILGHRFRYVAGVVIGEGKTVEDSSGRKDFYGRLAFKAGGLAFDGSQRNDTARARATDYWADNSLAIGVYTYHGDDTREFSMWQYNSPTDSLLVYSAVVNDFDRLGFDLQANQGRLDFLAGIIFGKDKNPDGQSGSKGAVNSRAWFGEGRYLLYPWCIGGLRLSGTKARREGRDLASFVGISSNLTMLARQNVRFTLESLVQVSGDKGSRTRWIKSNCLIAF